MEQQLLSESQARAEERDALDRLQALHSETAAQLGALSQQHFKVRGVGKVQEKLGGMARCSCRVLAHGLRLTGWGSQARTLGPSQQICVHDA